MKFVYVFYLVLVEVFVQQLFFFLVFGLGVGVEIGNQGIFGGNGVLFLGML